MSSTKTQRRPVGGQTVYIIELDASERERLRGLLASTFKNIETFDNAQSFLAEKIGSIQQGCLIAAAVLPGMSVQELIDRLKREGIHIPVIVLGDDSKMPLAISVMRAGAADFIERPFSEHRLKEAIRRALE